MDIKEIKVKLDVSESPELTKLTSLLEEAKGLLTDIKVQATDTNRVLQQSIRPSY